MKTVPITPDSNASRLETIQELQLPGFHQYRPYGLIRHRLVSTAPVQQQYEHFVSRIGDAVGKSSLLVYRMADGEFSFLLGPRPSVLRAKMPLRQRLSEYARYLSYKVGFRSLTTCWGENYSEKEIDDLRIRMRQSVKHVAERGVLGLYFALRDDHWGEQYYNPMCSWLDCSGITLSEGNYIPFYFVYALLHGPARREILASARVLVITHLTTQRVEAIDTGLRDDGAATVEFLNISANRSMTDKLDLSTVRRPVDLVLIAAGIGSVNILVQLEQFSAPCIDCGITLDCYVNPELRWKRAFLMDDERLMASDWS